MPAAAALPLDALREHVPGLDGADAEPIEGGMLHGPSANFRNALLSAYAGRVDGPLRARAAFYHLLGPCYEVTYGLDTTGRDFVESGLAGIRARLR